MDTVLYNDKVYKYALTTVSGVAIPSGANPVATSSAPNSLNAGIFNGVLTLTPLVQQSTGITVTITGIGVGPASQTFDIAADPNLVVLAFGTPTTVAQAIPTAPGP